MRKLLFAILPLFFACWSCSIQTYTFEFESRQPSRSGLDLGGKTVAVAYLTSISGIDSTFNRNLSDGFAQALEDDGTPQIAQYMMIKNEDGVYSSKDTLVNLIMDTGADVVFLFDTPNLGSVNEGTPKPNTASGVKHNERYIYNVSLPYEVHLYAYDSMDKTDTVRTFKGRDHFSSTIFGRGDETPGELRRRAASNLARIAETAGKKAAESFESEWKPELFAFTYVDNLSGEWLDALQYVYLGDFDKAIDIWTRLLKARSLRIRSAAEYNIAMACYLSGEYALSEKWLSLSDKDNRMVLSESLHTRLNSKLK